MYFGAKLRVAMHIRGLILLTQHPVHPAEKSGLLIISDYHGYLLQNLENARQYGRLFQKGRRYACVNC